jgi:anti-sigma-K factor RskA
VRCSEFKASVWAFALDALEPTERAELERHLAEPIAHEGCEDELERAMRTAQTLSAVAPAVTPPAESWSKIEARVAGERQTGGRRARRPAWLPWTVSFIAAAACALLLVKAWTYRSALVAQNAEISQLRDATAERDACRQELEAIRKGSQAQRAALALLELPSTQLVPISATPESKSPSRGTALLNMEERRAVVLISALSPAVGRDYELWVIRAGSPPVPAGILKPGQDGRAIAEIDRSLLQTGRPDIFAVTVEPPGGSPAPTTTPFLRGDVKG